MVIYLLCDTPRRAAIIPVEGEIILYKRSQLSRSIKGLPRRKRYKMQLCCWSQLHLRHRQCLVVGKFVHPTSLTSSHPWAWLFSGYYPAKVKDNDGCSSAWAMLNDRAGWLSSGIQDHQAPLIAGPSLETWSQLNRIAWSSLETWSQLNKTTGFMILVAARSTLQTLSQLDTSSRIAPATMDRWRWVVQWPGSD